MGVKCGLVDSVTLAALAAVVFVSLIGVAPAQTESDERAMRDYIADMDGYRAKLKADLSRKQAKLLEAETAWIDHERVLRELSTRVNRAPGSGTVPGAASAAGDSPEASLTPRETAKLRKQLDAQTYRTVLARNTMSSNREEVMRIEAILSRMQQRP
jgi:hypothetical protein